MDFNIDEGRLLSVRDNLMQEIARHATVFRGHRQLLELTIKRLLIEYANSEVFAQLEDLRLSSNEENS